MRKKGIRLVDIHNEDDTGVRICNHIKIVNASKVWEECEYIERIEILCKECKEVYTYKILVN